MTVVYASIQKKLDENCCTSKELLCAAVWVNFFYERDRQNLSYPVRPPMSQPGNPVRDGAHLERDFIQIPCLTPMKYRGDLHFHSRLQEIPSFLLAPEPEKFDLENLFHGVKNCKEKCCIKNKICQKLHRAGDPCGRYYYVWECFGDHYSTEDTDKKYRPFFNCYRIHGCTWLFDY